jgi:hypothetical protein
VVVTGANAGDLGRRAEQRPCDLAGDHVHFVAVGQRDHQVRAVAAGGFEHGRVGGVARHGADVEAVLQVAQHLVARVHDRHVVGLLAGQLLGRGRADLAGAENDDLQVPTPLPEVTPPALRRGF